MPNDAAIAGVGRELAEALADVAYSRKPEDQKRVAEIQTRLCAAVRAERIADADAADDAAREEKAT